MPRGFLIKRTRKSGGSYRIPCEETGPPQSLPLSSVLDVLTPYGSALPPSSELVTGTTELEQPQQVPLIVEGASQVMSDISPIKENSTRLETMEHWRPLPHSPIKPVAQEIKKPFFRRFPTSPASAESFPVAASFASMEKLLIHHNPFMTPEAKLHTNVCSRDTIRSNKLPSKKNKVTRKLNFLDEVTTSPVLGLKIKAEDPDCKARSPLAKRPPLGEFICQLCKEQYPDPFALAQHKCSRIVRVEYRCPECDKIFSCPANLASHRRWHKPRALGSDGQGGKKMQTTLEGKENSSSRISTMSLLDVQSSRVQHQHPMDSSQLTDQHLLPGNSSCLSRAETETPVSQSNSEDGEEEAYDCPYCHKRFRRHAYLRKHLLTHQPYSTLERGPLTFPCTLCGVHFPSMDIRDKHRLWHAVREELLIPLEDAMVAEGGQQIFPCELCPTAFFSSPGLTLHMNKCHSSDGRQEITQQIPLGPGC
ncbi:insulinoma-associated protein 2 [Rhinophrynus dorsalis]